MQEPRVLVAQPLYSHVPPAAAASWTAFILGVAGRGAAVFQTVNMYIDQVRNDAVKHALRETDQARGFAEPFTHILFVDSDMVVPMEGMDQLLALKKPIASGLYFGKLPPFSPVAFMFTPTFKRLDDYLDDTVMEVDGVGAGFLLIDLDVFRKMREHYKDENWFRCGESQAMGEDVWFFSRTREMGIKCHLDTRVLCGHVGELVITNATFRNTAVMDELIKDIKKEEAA